MGVTVQMGQPPRGVSRVLPLLGESRESGNLRRGHLNLYLKGKSQRGGGIWD